MPKPKRLTADELAAIDGRIAWREANGDDDGWSHDDGLALRQHIAALEADLAAAEAVCEMVEAFWRGETTSELGDAVAAWRKRRAERGTR